MTSHADREYEEERYTNSIVPNSLWEDPSNVIEDKPLRDEDGNPLYTKEDLWPVYEGCYMTGPYPDGKPHYEVKYHILHFNDEFQPDTPPTKSKQMMIYFYEGPDGEQDIMYTCGEERRFNQDTDLETGRVEFKDINGISRFTQRGINGPPSHYSHVRVCRCDHFDWTRGGWVTLVATGIKKIIPQFTMSVKEIEEFEDMWNTNYDKSSKTLFEHMGKYFN
tara:strand:+ start:989 stop:1651 length:663 start_codon:yes stop_codon:yes gene_type:complete